MLQKFNIGKCVYVQITDEGWKHLRRTLTEPEDYIKYCIEPYKIIIDDKIWYKMQLFSVMELLGYNMFVNPKIKPLIYIDSSDLTESVSF